MATRKGTRASALPKEPILKKFKCKRCSGTGFMTVGDEEIFALKRLIQEYSPPHALVASWMQMLKIEHLNELRPDQYLWMVDKVKGKGPE